MESMMEMICRSLRRMERREERRQCGICGKSWMGSKELGERQPF